MALTSDMQEVVQHIDALYRDHGGAVWTSALASIIGLQQARPVSDAKSTHASLE